MSSLAASPAVDLDICAKEPIRIPGSVQAHGCLIACDMTSWKITHVSRNLGPMFGITDVEALLDKPADALLTPQALHDIRNVLQASSVSGQAELLPHVALSDTLTADVMAHVSGSAAIIEFLPGTGAQVSSSSPMTLVRSMITRVKRAPTFERSLTLAANQVRAVTGFDRVMIYRFLQDESGEVVAESLRSGLTPFLNLRYPASDIPAQARQLYLTQWLRLIPDVFYEPSPLLAAPNLEAPLDLGLATLRSVSPIHIEYLKNMGSSATLTISLIVGDKLWGLIACHHIAPRLLSSGIASACELFGQVLSLHIDAQERARELSHVSRSRDAHERLINSMPPETTLFDDVARYEPLLKELIPCDGIGIWYEGVFSGVGSLPPAELMPDLVAALDQQPARQSFAVQRLDTLAPSAAAYRSLASGVLAIPFARTPRDYLLFFRKELPQVVQWGGNPNKAVEVTGHGTRIGPRKSFAAWREEVTGQSAPWLPAEIHIAEGLRVSLLDVILRRSDITERQQRNAQEGHALLIAELNHRVKNILALIRSLVRQSQHGAASIGAFTSDLEQRIRALSFAHDQMTQSGWTAAPLRRLLEAEAKAWARGAIEGISFAGPPVMLDPRAYQALALVFHEMMTNAAKYGSLSQPGGHLDVDWTTSEEGALTIRWIEKNGPVVRKPERRGFGSVIMEQTVPFELRGEARLDYLPDGLSARFMIPALHVTLGSDEDEPSLARLGDSLTLTGKRLLLVEDSMMVALDAQVELQGSGLTVDVAGTVSDALRTIAVGRFDAVLLDINLAGETSFGVADVCVSQDVPIVFATGYGESVKVPERFLGIPIVSKPYDGDTLRAALELATAAE
ncbi:HWE histidine kinase domain-containing protein [Lichenihabitans sp. Uapishka_5]|uniref:HWE histidine kinase domain-containing protein n=1 Tax=Lichenihabitans sp. Uapishka_5 TaxID=3037302 RepID=UPI0029E8068B|nr:HWE histidine kinase domain-containing protein [Lichenihabitans sp. Uapishka_5]MDX7950877.1 HWE histidine kinase domain-containing protein [Lichenihabitans sp. Uapishka_5]